MSATNAQVPPRFTCKEPGCERTAFSTRANLKRHTRAKHGPAAYMPCGKRLPNHACNTRRHKMTCQRCHAITGSPSTPDEQNSLGSPTSISTGAIETPYFEPTYNTSLGDLNDMIHLNEDYSFEIL